jgi:hypothetical protein
MTAISETILDGTRAQLEHWREECSRARAAGDAARIEQCQRHIQHLAAVMESLEKVPHSSGSA